MSRYVLFVSLKPSSRVASGTETDRGSAIVVAGIDMVVLTGEDTTRCAPPVLVGTLVISPFDLGRVTTWHEF